MKKIAVVNDLSGLGRCSLTAALPILSVMGYEVCPLPTAVLSNQTGYKSFYFADFTEHLAEYAKEWKNKSIRFDAILTGYTASEKQADIISGFIDDFRTENTLLLVDPVMADDGEIYGTYTTGLCKKIKDLAEKADIITPNLTELCILTDSNYDKLTAKSEDEDYIKIIGEKAKELISDTLRTVIVTGVKKGSCVCTVTAETDKISVAGCEAFGGSYSGTGDIFSSVVCGKLLGGESAAKASEAAVRFLEKSIKDSYLENSDRNDGVNFQKYLEMLL